DFLEALDNRSFFTPLSQTVTLSLVSTSSFANTLLEATSSTHVTAAPPPVDNVTNLAPLPLLPSVTKAEKFLLTATDQELGAGDECLNPVFQRKY
ncbi:hypothetical protein EDC04DRAFT_2962919, partial [Pisolithus marmoratus]